MIFIRQLSSVVISSTATAYDYCLSVLAHSAKRTLLPTHVCPLTGTAPDVLHLLCLYLLLPLILSGCTAALCHKHNDLLPLAE